MNRLVLIDGNAILHRAYHALPLSLTNSKGEPTNAVYGFVAILLKTIEDLKPSHLAVCFDRPGGTFRNELFKDYQAQRPEVDDSFVSQIKKVHRVVEAMKIPIHEKDGYEADDVIATLASQVGSKSKINPFDKLRTRNQKSKLNMDVIIVTGDRDLLQLVNHKVKLYMPVKGLNETKLFGEKEAEERMGVSPKQIPDLKALMGDPSDNYPGVDGIGPKTAVALLKQFGTVAKLYNKINEVNNDTIRNKLLKDKANALLSLQLATVVRDAPVKFDLDSAQLRDLFTREVIGVFGELGFKTLLKRLSNMSKGELKKPAFAKVSAGKEKEDEEQMELFN